MHIRQIERTELNGMVLQHTQTLPEIHYNGCVICFITFDGDIECVGSRIINLNTDEFKTLKKLIEKIEFEDVAESTYAERAKSAMESIHSAAGKILLNYDLYNRVHDYDLDPIREKLVEIDLINAQLDRD